MAHAAFTARFYNIICKKEGAKVEKKKKEKTRYGMTPEKAMEVYTADSTSNLKAARVKKGLSQQELADILGVSRYVISSYERGYRDIDGMHLMTLCKIAQALDCRVGDILQGEEQIKLYKKYK